jgi:hypothetical protein
MVDYSTLPPKERSEVYRRFAADAVENARKAPERTASLYLDMAEQWLRLAEFFDCRVHDKT